MLDSVLLLDKIDQVQNFFVIIHRHFDGNILLSQLLGAQHPDDKREQIDCQNDEQHGGKSSV